MKKLKDLRNPHSVCAVTSSEGVYYRAVQGEEHVFEQSYRLKIPLLLKGPTGCGKSRFVESMAQKLARPLVTVSCHEDTSATDLLGRHLIHGGDTIWQDGPLTRAVKEGAILYLDEVIEAREDVIVAIHSITDHRREIFLDGINTTIKAPEEFMLVMSFNPRGHRRLKDLKMSTRQRFVALDFFYPPPSIESEIVSHESGLDMKIVSKLVKVCDQIRKSDELGLSEPPSTRLLVHAARLIGAGLDAREAFRMGVIQPLTDDRAIAQALGDLSALSL